MKLPILWRSSGRYLSRHPILIALSILGVALGVAVVVAIDLANTSARQAFALSAETVTGKATHQLIGTGDALDESIYRDIRLSLGFRDAAPVVTGYANALDNPGRTLQIFGIDPLSEAPFRSFTGGDRSDLDLGTFMARPNTGLLSAPSAAELSIDVGDTVALTIGGKPTSIEIVALLEPGDPTSAQAMQNLLVVDISTAQELLGLVGKLSYVDLIIPESEAGADILAGLSRFGSQGAEVVRSAARTSTVEQMTRAFSLNLTALSLLALVVGMFLIYNTMTFSVVQRRSVVGRLRVLGVTRKEVFKLVMVEAAAIGLAGTVIGLVVGLILGQGLVQLVSQTINDLYFVLTVRAIDLSPWTLAKGIGLGIGATLLATLGPAREASTAPAGNILRRSEEESSLQRRLPALTLGGVALAAFAVVLLLLPGQGIAISYVALLCILIAFALITPWAVTRVATAARSTMGRLGGILGRMAARGIVTTLSRTAVAIAALTIAISATVGVGVMIDSFRTTVQVWLGYTLQADIYVSPPSLVFRRNDSTLDPAVAEILKTTAGVEGAFSVRSTRVTSTQGRVDMVVIDPSPKAREAFRFKEGDPDEVWSSFRNSDIVIVSEPYSYRHGVAVGDTLSVQTATGDRAFAVRAIYYDYGSDLGVVMMGRGTYDTYFDDPGIAGIALYASPGQDVDELIAQLRLRVGDRQELLIRSNRALREASLEVFDRTFTVTIVLRLLAVLVAFVGVLSALMALQLEKSRELAVLRANGLTPKQVWRYVTMQTGLMGLTAGIFSVPLGLILASVLIYIVNKRSFGWTLQLEISPEILVQAVVLAVVAALAAGIYPSWKMARENTASGLRRE